MKYKWTDRSVFNYYYDIETGSIVAKLSRISFSDDVWNAEINGDFLGQYISEAHGREAIEKKVKEIDAEIEELRKTHPKLSIRKAQEK